MLLILMAPLKADMASGQAAVSYLHIHAAAHAYCAV